MVTVMSLHLDLLVNLLKTLLDYLNLPCRVCGLQSELLQFIVLPKHLKYMQNRKIIIYLQNRIPPECFKDKT